MAGSSEQILRN